MKTATTILVTLVASVIAGATPAAAQLVVGGEVPDGVVVNWSVLERLGPPPNLATLLQGPAAAAPKPGRRDGVYHPYVPSKPAKRVAAKPVHPPVARTQEAKAPIAPASVPVASAPVASAPVTPAPAAAPAASSPPSPTLERPPHVAKPVPPRPEMTEPPPAKAAAAAPATPAPAPVAAAPAPAPVAAPKGPQLALPEVPKTEPVKDVAKPVPPPAPVQIARVEPAPPPAPPPVAVPAAVPAPAPAPEVAPPPVKPVSLPSTAPASAVIKKGDSLSVVFPPDTSRLPDPAWNDLGQLAQRMMKDETLNLQLLAYAPGEEVDTSKARRLSLSRALAVRSFLMDQGVRSTRIEVRALGNKIEGDGPPDRVDLVLTAR